MAIKPFNWHCPHCDHKVMITDGLYLSNFHKLYIDNADGPIGLFTEFLVCPNAECQKPTLRAAIREWVRAANGDTQMTGRSSKSWRLIPEGNARPFPDFVPQAIRDDYREACLIRDLSPKSSATLARRALQGILRDFYKVKPGRLVNEINSLEESMEPELWEAIHGVRQVGNIGAHMGADINLIVDVDPDEAQLLIELVETMIEETYVRRDQRQNRVRRVTELAAAKELARKAVPDASSGTKEGE